MRSKPREVYSRKCSQITFSDFLSLVFNADSVLLTQAEYSI